LKDNPAEGHGLFAMGDPDFEASIDARMKKSAEPLLATSTSADAEYQTRNVRSGCGSLSDLKVEGLPYTRNEVDGVRHLWQGKGADSAEVLVGAKATEDAFKTQAPGKRVIHLATHGYYLTGQCAPQIASRHSIGSEEGFVGENPLLQSGLLLAGCNLHGAGCDSAHCEDGILSASEVSGLDLTGTDLVVLSACETGLGEVKAGEGVYGLRRAFQMAGARTVISSLWPVPDQATADVMSQLYSQSKKSLPERLRDLQLAQIKKLRLSGLSDHPYSWAAFIALGDWR
jgi:CHAT domain-containing protein